jgi:hypothetical protein
MSDSQNRLSPYKTSSSRPARRPRPSFDEFLEAIRTAVAKPARVGFREVRRILSTGFAEKEAPQFISQVAEIIESCSFADRWAVSLAATDASGKLTKFQRELLGEVRGHFARRIGFYELDLGGPSFSQRMDKWLLREAPQRELSALPKRSDEPNVPTEALEDRTTNVLPFDSWLRWVFVCLVAKSPPDRRAEATLSLMEFWSGRGRTSSTDGHGEPDLYRFLGNMLAAEKPESRKIAPLISALRLTRSHLSAIRDIESILSRNLADAMEQIQIKDEAIGTLQQELSDARATAQQRSTEVENSQRRLVEAEERYRLLDEHWTRSSATSVAKKIGSLSEEVRHEVQEAILSLDRDVPNVPMALNRLRRLQAITNRQKGTEESRSND